MGNPFRLLTLVVLLSGCSASSVFSRREPHEGISRDESFAGARDSTPRGTWGDSRATRAKSESEQRNSSDGVSTDSKHRREIAEALAAGVRHEQQGDLRAARADYERVLRYDPQHAFAHYQLAVA